MSNTFSHHTNHRQGKEDSVRDIANRDGLLFWVVIDPAKPVTFDQAEIDADDKRKILYQNAEKLFNLEKRRKNG